MQMSHYFLRIGGGGGGGGCNGWDILPRFILSDFSQILAFDSRRKTSFLLQKYKIMYKNIVVSFYKQN